MSDKINLCIEKLNKKNEMLTEFFQYVFSKDFKIDIEEINHIQNYLAKRNRLLNEMVKLDKEIKKLKLNDEEKGNISIIEIVKKNDKIIKSIIDLDEKNNIKLEGITNILRGNIKSIKNARKATTNYFGVYNSFSEGNYFDRSR